VPWYHYTVQQQLCVMMTNVARQIICRPDSSKKSTIHFHHNQAA